jgi:hypothetical protein
VLNYLLAPTFQYINTAGRPLSGGAYLEVYIHGTRDKYYCASDFEGNLHPFQIPLDSLGANVVLAEDTGSYDVYAYNRYGSLIMSRYNVKPGSGGGSGMGTITSSDGSIEVTPTSTGVDLKVNGQEASALRAGANDLTSDGQFVFYELVRDGENVTVDTNGKIRLQEGWYHYDITARVKWEDGVTVDNTENHIQLYTTLNSDIIPFDCSYEHEDTLHLHGQVKIATSGSQFVVGVQGIESGMSIELVDCGLFAITGHGDNTEYTAGDGIVIDDHEISVDTSVIQEKLEAGDNIVIEGNVISATAEPQQQSDWTETDTSDVSYIKHKPTVKPVVAGANITITEGNDSFTISATAEPQEQANWNETDSSSVQYIQNKPDLSVYATSAELSAGLATKQDTISDLATIRSGAALGATATQPADLAPYATTADMNTALAGKQDTISDLATIRSGAALGATSVQPADLSTVATTGDYDDLYDKPDLSVYATSAELTSGLATKQDVISDLPDIRSGAALGETAVQPSDLATVATTGSYDDLTDKPVIPAAQVQADWDESDSSDPSYIQNKPDLSVYATDSELTAGLATKQDTISDLATIRSGAAAGATAIQPSDLATVATTGDYDDLTDKPDLSIYAESSNLATVATTGSYNDLVNKPTIPAAQVNSDWNASSGVEEILNKPTLSTVATTGDYDDLVNKPSIPAAQINSDWSESDTTSKAYIQNKPDLSVYATGSELTAGLATKQDTISDLATIRSGAEAGATAIQPSDLATVATTGDYDDLIDKPTIPSGVQLVPAATSSDASKVLTVDAQGTPAWAASQGLFVAQYGVTTYAQVVAAIEANKIVYCRIGADWDDSRMAFLAYDAHIGPNNNVEFQYVRSNSSISGYDSIFIYKVNSSGWTTEERSVKAGNISYPVTQVNVNGSSAMTGTVANITIPAAPTVDQTYDATSSNAQSGTAVAQAISGIDEVPDVTSSDNGKVLVATFSGGTGSYEWASTPPANAIILDSNSTWSDFHTAYSTGRKDIYYKHTSPYSPLESRAELYLHLTAVSDVDGTSSNFTFALFEGAWQSAGVDYSVRCRLEYSGRPLVYLTNWVVDQSYSASSRKAQSGVAVAQAISAVNQVPASTSSDEGKVLTVDSNGDAEWAPAQGGSTYTAGDGIDIANSEISVNYDSNTLDIVSQALAVKNPLPASTSSDANKVLKVNSSGTPEWAVGGGGGTYTAGTGIDIDQNNAISVENPLPSSTSADEGKVLKIDANGDPEWATGGGTQVQSDWKEADTTDPSYIQNKPTVMGLTAGSNVTITEGVSSITIAATDTTYTAGTGISITNGAISNSDPLPSHTSTESGKVLGVDSNGGLGWVNQSGGTTYTAGNMISLTNSEIAVSTTAGITDIQQVSALPANPVATVLYLIPET